MTARFWARLDNGMATSTSRKLAMYDLLIMWLPPGTDIKKHVCQMVTIFVNIAPENENLFTTIDMYS